MQKQENDENIDVDEELKKSKKERKEKRRSKRKSSKKNRKRSAVPSFPDDDTPLKVSSCTAITELSENVVTKLSKITCNITGCDDTFFTCQGLIHHMKGAHKVDLVKKEKNREQVDEQKEKYTEQVDEMEVYLVTAPAATSSINEEIAGDKATSTTNPVDTLTKEYCEDDPDDDDHDDEAVDAFADLYYEGDDSLGDEDDDIEQTGAGSQKTNPIEYQEGGAVTENKDGISESREKPFVKTVDENVSTNIERKNVTVSMAIAKVDVENSAPIRTSEASGILVIQEGTERDYVTENKDGKITTSVTENKDGKSATRGAVNISICSSDMCPLDHSVVESVKDQSDVAYGITEQDDSTRMSQHISEISVPEIPVMKSEGRRVCCQIESGSREIVIGTIEMQDEETKTIESQKDARHAMKHGKVQKRKGSLQKMTRTSFLQYLSSFPVYQSKRNPPELLAKRNVMRTLL